MCSFFRQNVFGLRASMWETQVMGGVRLTCTPLVWHSPLCTIFGPCCPKCCQVAHLNISCVMCTNCCTSSSPRPATPLPAGKATLWLFCRNHAHSTYLTNHKTVVKHLWRKKGVRLDMLRSSFWELLNSGRTVLEKNTFLGILPWERKIAPLFVTGSKCCCRASTNSPTWPVSVSAVLCFRDKTSLSWTLGNIF